MIKTSERDVDSTILEAVVCSTVGLCCHGRVLLLLWQPCFSQCGSEAKHTPLCLIKSSLTAPQTDTLQNDQTVESAHFWQTEHQNDAGVIESGTVISDRVDFRLWNKPSGCWKLCVASKCRWHQMKLFQRGPKSQRQTYKTNSSKCVLMVRYRGFNSRSRRRRLTLTFISAGSCTCTCSLCTNLSLRNHLLCLIVGLCYQILQILSVLDNSSMFRVRSPLTLIHIFTLLFIVITFLNV